MFLPRFTPYVLDRLAWRDLHRSGSLDQIFVVHAFSAIVHLDRSIFLLTDQGLGLRRSITFVLRLELQKVSPVLRHPIVADPAFRL